MMSAMPEMMAMMPPEAMQGMDADMMAAMPPEAPCRVWMLI